MSPNYGYFGFHVDFHWSLGERKQKSSNLENISILIHHNVHPPFLQGGWASNPISKKGGLTGPQLLEGVGGKEGVTFFRGVANFT